MQTTVIKSCLYYFILHAAFGGSNRNKKRCPLHFSRVKSSTSPQNSLCCEWTLPQAVRSTFHINSHLPAFAGIQIRMGEIFDFTLISQFFNTFLYTFAAFWGVYEIKTLMNIVFSSYVIFIFTSLLDPPAVYIARKLLPTDKP